MRFVATGLLAIALPACGDDDAAPADAAPADARGDATPTACSELIFPAGTIDSFPGSYQGDLAASTADLSVIEGVCASEQAPFGVGTPGQDQVVELRGLTPGDTYVVRLISLGDFNFYVVMGCSSIDTFGEGECLLFVDEEVELPEVGAFVAPGGGTAWVIVDQFMNGLPLDATFTVEVTPAECDDDDGCNGPTPYCVDRVCRTCRTDFECADPGAPVCDLSLNECGPGYGECTGDDPAENGDDGPAGATDATETSITAHVCSTPAAETDYYRFDVSVDGEGVGLRLEWPDAAVDLDLGVVDETGAEILGLSFHERPERIDLTFLPAGRYFVTIRKFELTPTTAAAEYTLTATRVPGTACTDAADCAAEFRNQLLRGECNLTSGACELIEGAGAVALGDPCDSEDDCVPEADLCSAFSFSPDLDTRGLCAPPCTDDGDCSPGQVCMTYGGGGYCSVPCTTDIECPAKLFEVPLGGGPWQHFSCDSSSGKCVL